MRFFSILTVCAGLLTVGACDAVTVNIESDWEPNFSPDRIKADIAFLADDTLEGRDTGSRGHRIAANYVAARFDHLGLSPMGGGDGFLQEVPFQTAVIDKQGSSFSVSHFGETHELEFGAHYFMNGSVKSPNGDVEGPLVFVGHGVCAPTLDHDDLDGVDLDGKIAVLLTGAPKSFNTETRAHYSSGAVKAQELRARGAVGMVTILDRDTAKRFSYDRLQQRANAPAFDWQYPEGQTAEKPGVAVSAVMNAEIASIMFEEAGVDLNAILDAAQAGEPMATADLKATAHLVRSSTLSEPFTSPNVAALLEGSDPVLKNEIVVLSAHLDHIGLNTAPEGEDNINNGALDNASGVSTLLEVARAFTESGTAPRRSILFLAVTGEEKGLRGAEYFAHFPTVTKANMVANVNLDMPILLYDFVDVVAFGAERSSLGGLVEAAAAQIGVTLSPDPLPEQNLFTRSDHYRFVQQGIPAVFLMTGFKETPDGDVGEDIFRKWLATDYHSVRDAPTLPIRYDTAAKFAKLNYFIAESVANADARPSWNEGDFFGDLFSK